MGTKVKIVLVKAHNSVGIVECYYRLIRRAYFIIVDKILDIGKDIAL
jgi:hypothetical protein